MNILLSFSLLLGVLISGCSSFTTSGKDIPREYRTAVVDGRELFIYVPPGYNASALRYPVMYVNDGEVLFGLHGWRLERKLDAMIASGWIGPMIVVGIGSSVHRTDEYLPYYDQYIDDTWGPYVPGASGFARFIVERIVPYVDASFRTIPERTARGLLGFSFGGLMAMWGAVEHDTVFSMAGGLSPSLWVDDYRYIRDMGSVERKQLKFWFDMGTREWNYYVPLIDTLLAKGYSYGSEVVYYEELGGSHVASSWLRRIEYPLILFNGQPAHAVMSHEMVLEVIRTSDQTGYYLRLNPVVDMDNGLRYSLSSAAHYSVLNPAAGTVNDDGSFSLAGTETLMVRVEYGALIDTVHIRPEEIEHLKTRL